MFLIYRCSGLFVFASSIYENSKRPLRIFRSVPNEGWFQEIERFNDQVHLEVNALSGMKFFCLTRSVLLGLAGTILTFELVLLQYNTTETELDAWVNCKH
jgi:gustatory receptor